MSIAINVLRKKDYEITRRVSERLVEIEKRMKNAIGIKKYTEEYHRHLDFVASEISKNKLSPLEKQYFNELIAEVSNLTVYNLERGNIETTHKIIQAVMFHLKKREKKYEMGLFGKEGVFFDVSCQKTYLTSILDS